jgi:WD40 repeat protein
MEKRVSTSARPAHKSKKPRIQPSSSPNKSSSLLSKNGVKIGHVTSNDGSTASKGVAFVDTASKRDVKSSRATQRGKGVALTPIKEAQEYPTSFKIIAGSYEKILYGLEATFDPSQPSTSSAVPILKPVFIFPAHVACIKAVAASPNGGKWLATGSTDEIIKVWDLRRRKEIGGLVQHEGVCNCEMARHSLFDRIIRFHNAPYVPVAIASPFRIGGRNFMSFPRTRLGAPKNSKRTYRSHKLRRCASIRKGRFKCG